ncbi:hypothetical protein CGCS363_v013464 [Colletotrichum siamense]|uniref:uncharacterized protein n=1 Tax=Colletotrichum siamense TaxID=690259 RepID=UPI00187325F6|nr:uncharacterized protein CGCS363_v013464 [Colletotrichum siamense]KAF5487463.1 hypothetical protein CGCS363_v013464 [Colletotrichum siamense]
MAMSAFSIDTSSSASFRVKPTDLASAISTDPPTRIPLRLRDIWPRYSIGDYERPGAQAVSGAWPAVCRGDYPRLTHRPHAWRCLGEC